MVVSSSIEFLATLHFRILWRVDVLVESFRVKFRDIETQKIALLRKQAKTDEDLRKAASKLEKDSDDVPKAVGEKKRD